MDTFLKFHLDSICDCWKYTSLTPATKYTESIENDYTLKLFFCMLCMFDLSNNNVLDKMMHPVTDSIVNTKFEVFCRYVEIRLRTNIHSNNISNLYLHNAIVEPQMLII
jgi:hypothetical protein